MIADWYVDTWQDWLLVIAIWLVIALLIGAAVVYILLHSGRW